MEPAMIVAAILVFAPALLMIYYLMKDYTYPAVEEPFFKDSTLFTLFAVGLIEGFIISAFYKMFISSWGNVLIGVAFALVQQLAILVVLNLKRFHRKSDTVFYGFSLGIGQGVGMAFGVTVTMLSVFTSFSDVDVTSWIIIVLFIAQELMLMCSTGATVGEGVARLRISEFTLKAILICVFCNIMWSFTITFGSSLLWIIPAIVMIVAATYFFYVSIYRGLPGVVADVLKLEGKKRNDIPK